MMNHIPVKETKPLAPYFGGKARMAHHITARIADIPHQCYAEPFIGMGGVFLRRPYKASVEVINDINGEIINLFRIVQQHHQPFMDLMQYQLHCRSEFERHLKTDPATLTDIQRAIRFLYLQLTCYGGIPISTSFSVSASRRAKMNAPRINRLIAKLHQRIAAVRVENLHYADFIARYDKPTTLFYLDPPYMGNEASYGHNIFYRDDFTRMAKILANIKGKFILSINDAPEIRQIYHRFAIEAVENSYTSKGNQRKKVTELLISG